MNQVTTGNKEICLLRSHISSKLTWMGMENLQKALFFAVLPSFKKSCTQLIQRVANRARVLLALDRGERIVDILPWVGMSRMAVWYLWQRYLERGVDAIFDEERSGRPPTFSPSRASRDRTRSLH